MQRLIVKKDAIWEIVKGSSGFPFQKPMLETDYHLFTSETFKSDVFSLFPGLIEAQ